MRDKTLAEYILSVCKQCETSFDSFKTRLREQGAELSDQALNEIYTLVVGNQHTEKGERKDA